MTFLAMGVLLLIRVVALAILIITSPVAFVGNIAGKDFGWWDNLFKYAFFGPIMVFVLHIAVFTMQAMSDSASLASETNIVTTMANMAIPIVILWMGMGIAQKMGIAGASDVVGKAQGWATSAGKNLGGIRPLASWGFKKTGIPDAAQQKWDRFKEQGRLGSDAVKKRASDFGNIGPLSEKNHATKEMLRQADEYKKNLAQSTELKAKCAAGDAAACYRLAEDGDMDTSTYTTYSSAANVNTDQRDTINKKLKKNRLDILITNKLTDQKDVDARITKILDANPGMNISMAESTARVNIAAEEFGKLSAEQWNDQYWKDVLESNNPIIVAGAFTAFNNLDSLARAEINKRLNGNNRKALMDSGIL